MGDSLEYEDGVAAGRAQLLPRITDLQVANNGYLERARKAEGERDDFKSQLEAANDQLADLRTEREADINAAQVELTWERMAKAKLSDDLALWTEEAMVWAKAYAEYRQRVELYNHQLDAWIANLKQSAMGCLLIDAVLIIAALLIIAGVVPPVLFR